jgi:hypothetical protein
MYDSKFFLATFYNLEFRSPLILDIAINNVWVVQRLCVE